MFYYLSVTSIYLDQFQFIMVILIKNYKYIEFFMQVGHREKKQKQNKTKLGKHAESTDLRQAYYEESFKKFLHPDCYLDHPQNLISSSSFHFRHFLKISSKSVHKFLSYVANKQTNKPTNKPTNKQTNQQTNPVKKITSQKIVSNLKKNSTYNCSSKTRTQLLITTLKEKCYVLITQFFQNKNLRHFCRLFVAISY